ncbi:MAG: EAL domain-containing protein [Thermodesulfovibrionales bacterium]
MFLFNKMSTGFQLCEMIYDAAGAPHDYRFLAINPAFETLTGLKRTSVIGRTVREILPSIEQHWIETFGRVAQTGEPVHLRHYAHNRDRHYDAYAFSPQKGRFAVLFLDVTEYRRADEELSADFSALKKLHEVSTHFVMQEDLGSLLEGLIDAALFLSSAERGTLQLLEPASGELKILAHRGFNRSFLEFFSTVVCDTSAVCGAAMRQKERVIVEDVTQSPLFAGSPALEVLLGAGVRAVQATPLISRTGRLVGIVSTHWRVRHRSDERVLRMMDLLAGQAADAIEAMQAKEALRESEERFRRQNAVLQGINRIFRESLTCSTEEELGRICLRVAEEVTGSAFGFIGEINKEGKLDNIAISDPGWSACRMGSTTAHQRVSAGSTIHGLYGRVLIDGKFFFTNNPPSHPDSIGTPPGHPPLKAFLGAPLLHGGKTIGMVGLGNRAGGYRAEDQEALEALAPAIVQVIMHKRMEREIEHRAYHDMLTGLPNRRLFMDILSVELAKARRSRAKCSVLFLDLDRFKYINDTLGHDIGDILLKEAAERLKRSIRESDIVARIGGDEFNIFLTDISHAEDVVTISQKIVDSFREPYKIGGHSLAVSTSIGISIFPDDAGDREALFKNADIAMYHAKELGGNAYHFYDPTMNIRTIERLSLESRLRQSLHRGELTVHYQPQIDLRTGQVVCAEALVRWQHPEQGLLDPRHFILVAEETGFISDIDEWVLRTTCAQFKQWWDEGLPSLCATVNLSAKQFQKADLAERVFRILEETGFDPGHLILEITEGVAMKNLVHTASTMTRLSERGVGIAIDDFGTGYSSLNHLKKLPIRKLKIDRSFVKDVATDPDDRAIVEAVAALARSMKLCVTAEGVESEEQREFLESVGFQEMQGFLFSRPLTAEGLKELISGGKRRAAQAD